jgi:chromate transporter
VADTGSIAGVTIVLGRRSLTDIPTVILAIATIVLLGKYGKKLSEPIIVASAAAIGLVIYILLYD